MDILLHLGAHRTATTTLQRYLGQNRAALAAARVQYWGPKRLRSGVFRGLYAPQGPVLALQGDRASGRIALRLREAEDHGVGALVVSEENMLGTVRASLGDGALYRGAGARVARFAAPFKGHRVTLGLAVRSLDAWWASALAFQMPRGGPLPQDGLCTALARHPRGWRDVVAEIAGAVPWARLVVWPYEQATSWAPGHIGGLLGLPLQLAGPAGWHNASASPEHLRALVAEFGCTPDIIQSVDGRFMPFDADQRAALAARYADDLDWLAAGADGSAEFLTTPFSTTTGAKDAGATGSGRGSTDERRQRDDAHHRRLARSG